MSCLSSARMNFMGKNKLSLQADSSDLSQDTSSVVISGGNTTRLRIGIFLGALLFFVAGIFAKEWVVPTVSPPDQFETKNESTLLLEEVSDMRREVLEEDLYLAGHRWNLLFEESGKSHDGFSRFVLERWDKQKRVVLREDHYWAIGMRIHKVVVSPDDTPRRFIIQSSLGGLGSLDVVLGVEERDGDLLPLEPLEIEGLSLHAGPNLYIDTWGISFIDNDTVTGLTSFKEREDDEETIIRNEVQLWEAPAHDLNDRRVIKTYSLSNWL